MTSAGLPILSKTTTLVGLGHRARQGKNTVADMLLDILRSGGLKVRDYSFAGPLYDHCRVNHGMTSKDAPLLQKVGVEMRERDENVWVRTCLWRIMTDAPDVAVIPDCRFQNEATAIQQQGGLVAKVERYNADGTLFVDPSRPANHISEIDLDGYDFDAVIANGGTLDDLYPKALMLAAQVAHHRLHRLRA